MVSALDSPLDAGQRAPESPTTALGLSGLKLLRFGPCILPDICPRISYTCTMGLRKLGAPGQDCALVCFMIMIRKFSGNLVSLLFVSRIYGSCVY